MEQPPRTLYQPGKVSHLLQDRLEVRRCLLGKGMSLFVPHTPYLGQHYWCHCSQQCRFHDQQLADWRTKEINSLEQTVNQYIQTCSLGAILPSAVVPHPELIHKEPPSGSWPEVKRNYFWYQKQDTILPWSASFIGWTYSLNSRGSSSSSTDTSLVKILWSKSSCCHIRETLRICLDDSGRTGWRLWAPATTWVDAFCILLISRSGKVFVLLIL